MASRFKLDILDTQSLSLHQSLACAIHQPSQQTNFAIDGAQQPRKLFLGEHGRQALRLIGAIGVLQPRQINVQNLEIQKQSRTQGLIMG